MSEYVVDAHALIWNLEGNPRLGAGAKAALAASDSILFVPSVALIEACRAIVKGRTGIADWRSVIQAVRADSRVMVVAMDLEIVELSMTLPPSIELHDGVIIATLLSLQKLRGGKMELLTVDRTITDSGLVPVLW